MDIVPGGQTFLSPWDLPDIFPVKPPEHPYGIMTGKKMIGCSREELIKRCSRDQVPPIHLVWTPDAPRLVPPAEVLFLLNVIEARAMSRGKRTAIIVLFSLAVLGIGYLLFFGTASPPPPWTPAEENYATIILLFNVLFAGLLPFGTGSQLIRSSRFILSETLANNARAIRCSVWVSMRHAFGTLGIAILIALVGIAQVKAGLIRSIVAGGLDKDLIRHGEYLRLLTCTMLHGNLFHFCVNTFALLFLGRLVEVLADRAYLMIVYLVSGLAGSVTSILMLPNTTSIGASGALMGLVGFLGMLGYCRRSSLPPGFLRSIFTSFCWIALVGWLTLKNIDNAACSGGFYCGLIMGWAMIGRNGQLPLAPSNTVKIAGFVSAFALIVTAGVCVAKILVVY